jgi:hypothetical protein
MYICYFSLFSLTTFIDINGDVIYYHPNYINDLVFVFCVLFFFIYNRAHFVTGLLGVKLASQMNKN